MTAPGAARLADWLTPTDWPTACNRLFPSPLQRTPDQLLVSWKLRTKPNAGVLVPELGVTRKSIPVVNVAPLA